MTREPISLRTRFRILQRDGFACRYCGRSAKTVELEVDHVRSVARGGSTDDSNLVAACFDCNRGKRDDELDAVIPNQRATAVAFCAMVAMVERFPDHFDKYSVCWIIGLAGLGFADEVHDLIWRAESWEDVESQWRVVRAGRYAWTKAGPP